MSLDVFCVFPGSFNYSKGLIIQGRTYFASKSTVRPRNNEDSRSGMQPESNPAIVELASVHIQACLCTASAVWARSEEFVGSF